MNKKAQLFLIEVIIALSVLLILVTTLFATQNFNPPVDTNDLQQRGEQAVEILVDSGDMVNYLKAANHSFYTVNDDIMSASNLTKVQIVNTISASLPVIANFKAHTDRYNDTLGVWERIDIVNYETSTPTTGELVVIEYYTPGFDGVYAQFRFKLTIWYEVDL